MEAIVLANLWESIMREADRLEENEDYVGAHQQRQKADAIEQQLKALGCASAEEILYA